MEYLTRRFEKEVFGPYQELLRAEYRFHHTFSHAKKIWEAKLTKDELVSGPHLEKSQTYKTGDPLSSLPLHEKTIATVGECLEGRDLYEHQSKALKLILNNENAIITTGTSSGKTLCYQIPILDDLIRNPETGLRAIIIYPLNALVNDQLNEWEKLLKNHPNILFARFTGQTPDDQKEYVGRLKDMEKDRLNSMQLTQQELQVAVNKAVAERLKSDIPNRLNHREEIRKRPPHILITNFSMLEYLLERPIDADIFRKARLNFIVLDEVHAYRGVQATEIAFLIRRLKDRLDLEKVISIATSATIGKRDDPESITKVRKFASSLFAEQFSNENPIYGDAVDLSLVEPSFEARPSQYIQAVQLLREGKLQDVLQVLSNGVSYNGSLASFLSHDKNLFRLRKDILNKPTLLKTAAEQLWPNADRAEEGLQALLEIVATAKSDGTCEDLLPTRLHYFIHAQDGLYVCLNKNCPGRIEQQATFFVSRKSDSMAAEGDCPNCKKSNITSMLVEVVTCRKCGYLFGALQDLGPRRKQDPEEENQDEIHFDSFSTELGWAGDSFWTYFSVDGDLPYPQQPQNDENDDNLLLKPAEMDWCVTCGKKRSRGAGDNCTCEAPNIRSIKVFHRQCSADDRANLDSPVKKLLSSCPNCGARNSSGLEPLRRFQESDDEMGLSMAIPLAHFQVSNFGKKGEGKIPRKLLCFTDHRQRAAAFPSLLEEETFFHDLGRKIVQIVTSTSKPIDLLTLSEKMAESTQTDPDFFLPISRLPEEEPQAREIKNLWTAEVMSYFGIPDSARESAEDLGLVTVKYHATSDIEERFHNQFNLGVLSIAETTSLLQLLLTHVRQKKAFTLPSGVHHSSPAFGRVVFDIGFALKGDKGKHLEGWLPKSSRGNFVTDFLRRVYAISDDSRMIDLAKQIWDFLTQEGILIESRRAWKLDHEKIVVSRAGHRFRCSRCGFFTSYSVKQLCPRKSCQFGQLQPTPFEPSKENIIARWVAGVGWPQFTSLRSEEHTAQVPKDAAKKIEDEFRRAEGVNLLSSTTTFEMGINIGDLQKVLLRNAPPSSASYIQRVGRTGRGRDKNSVAVTLCRRTKYDADIWDDPSRVMMGEVKAPTVFTENEIIVQRHFNAVVFSKFLKIKIADERMLVEIKQEIALAPFLPLSARQSIPENLQKVCPKEIYLDFVGWLLEQGEDQIFNCRAGRMLLLKSGDFSDMKEKSADSYKKIMDNVSEELVALMAERAKLYSAGLDSQVKDIGDSIKNLLSAAVINLLAKRGFLPRYAFPLDVVTLETGLSRWSRDADVELSRDRGIAIAEFAPGGQVIARKKVFTSEGLYVVSNSDRPDRRWYSVCPSCKQIRTDLIQEPLLGPCRVCNQTITTQHLKPFLEPQSFSVRIELGGKKSSRYGKTSLIRQRQSITHFIDSVDSGSFEERGLFHISKKQDGHLFRYNAGPKTSGFMFCPQCGCSQPIHQYRGGSHKRLRPFSGKMECSNERVWKGLAYGHQFKSFCLLARPVSQISNIESLAFALQRGFCRLLDIEPNDIGVSWRRLEKPMNGGSRMELVYYDRTPGGTGFSEQGFNNWDNIVSKAREICEACKCEKSCYNCLKDYSNQAYHDKLDRAAVVSFLNLE